MEYIGLDVHKNESQICLLSNDGEIVERRILTRHDRFAEALGKRPRARILIEASTESEWVARCLEELGHEVIVADPNFAPMYATRSRRVKTDRRDAQALPVVQRLCTAPGIGPVTAVAFVSTLDLVQRFEGAHQVQAHPGLVPSEFSSGERQQRGAITKTGNTRLRWLLVEAAWSILRSRHSRTAELRLWAQRIALRRGQRIAIVALARKLAGILFAMWRDETEFGKAERRSRRSADAV
jgi:transposase